MICFFHENEEFGCFSNWFYSPFNYGEMHYISAEQYMMYQKVMLFHRFDLGEQIMGTEDPAEAKKIARQPFPEFNSALWERLCYHIVKRGVGAKFRQNEEIREILLNTGNELIAECSPYDKKWGIGIDITDSKRLDVRQWKGRNLLGRVLMEVREELMQERAAKPVNDFWYNDVTKDIKIPEWEMTAGELKRIPQFYQAIHTYSDTLKGQYEREAFYNGKLTQWDEAMHCNLGGGLPISGFYEMKQEVYDIALRLKHVRETKSTYFRKKTLQERWDEDGLSDNRGIINFPGCKGCIFAEPDNKVTRGYTKGICAMFNGEQFKPHNLYEGGQCPYYEEEEKEEMPKEYNGIMGLVVGDAVGVPAEFKTRDYYKITDMQGYGTYDQPPGTWSDDSSMTLATVESVARLGKIDPTDIMKNFLRWTEGEFTPYGEMFDIGRTTRNAIQRYAQGVPVDKCGSAGERDNGNGSLMRILPLAFTDCDDIMIDAVSSLTHAHEISKIACRIYVHTARKLLKGEELETILDAMAHEPLFERLPLLKTLERNEIKSTGYVVDTLEAALWCILHSNSYRECILLAVNLGEDTDTVAAVAGGLAGIIYGVDGEKGIPEDWIIKIERKEWITELCKEFSTAVKKIEE